MKRTTFIAPVESMRGNLSGKQDLRYANENNKAFDAPEGRQYAKNYRASYIGARRAADGLTYFAVKTKSATKIDADSLKKMAAFGATGSMVGSIFRQKSNALFESLLRIYGAQKIQGILPENATMREFLSTAIYSALLNFQEKINFYAKVGTTELAVEILNPFMNSAQTTGAEIPAKIIQKFLLQLKPDAVKIPVQGTKLEIMGSDAETFANLIANDALNVLQLHAVEGILVSGVYGDVQLLVSKTSAVDQPSNLNVDDDIVPVEGAYYYLGDVVE